MPPIRTREDEGASPSVKSQNRRPKRRHTQHSKDSAPPSISKIKSSLRQTRRLLAKGSLAADVRVETERRLKALESDLARAELAKKERTLAMRYHKIKFFERQKVLRRIKQTKKELSAASSESARRKLEESLYQLRIDLNYILHYPRLKKYVSLFPPEIRKGQSAPTTTEEDAAKTTEVREEVRAWIRSCMEKGELSNEPESASFVTEQKHLKVTMKDYDETAVKNKTKMKSLPAEEDEDDDKIENDEFFGEDEDDDDGDSGDSSS